MKRVCFCCVAGLLSFNSKAQSDSVTLFTFSKARSAHFAEQQRNVTTYAQSHNQPVFFKDENGNPVYMVGITASGLPIYWTTLNADAAVTTNVVSLRSGGTAGLNLLGEGMRVGVWDGGRVKDHIELGQRIISKEGTTDDNHATHVTGTLIASGINPLAKGMAPLAEASTHDFLNDEAEMAALAQTDQSSLLFSNHSYGTATGWFKKNGVWEWTGDPSISPIEDYRFGFYDTRAQAIDQIAYLAPYYTIVWATGNDRADTGDGSKPADCNGGSGYDCIIPEGVSKNSITVGAVNKVLSYSNPFDVTMSFFSSWGPTDDGRIKPDLVGAGVNLFSLSADGTDTYTTMTGTSMSTPNVTGSLLLLQELYSKTHGGSFMRAATVKALAIHTAKEAGGFPGPDYSFGWGLLDAGAAANILLGQNDQSTFVKELTLKNDSTFQLALHPAANQKITATIAWTDPPANPLAPSLDPINLMLVNDLDLRIIDEQGREQFPWTLDPANPSRQSTRADNFRDNVEKIEFDLPEGKDYTLVVRHKAALAGGRQDFSLILSYKPIQPLSTFYWIGDSGNWTDGSHWSFGSAGPPCMMVPGLADQVIIDENSFDGIGTDGISFSQDAGCASFRWLNSRPSGISLNNNTLSIGSQWIVGAADFSIQTQGKIRFMAGNKPGNFFVQDNRLTGATLIFDGGSWNVRGNFNGDELRLNSGSLTLSASLISLDRLVTGAAFVKELHLTNTAITLAESSSMDGNGLTISANHSSLIIGSTPVTLQWQSVNFPAEIRIGSASKLTVNGNNRIGKISGQGKMLLNGSNSMDTLILEAGAEMELGPASVQTLSQQTQLLGNSTHPVAILSTAPSSLLFSDHANLCFDFLNISNVEVKGKAVVNAGTNSILFNAVNWQQKECGEVLFADFEVRYNCANGSTEFTDESSGQVLNYTWHFGTNPESVHQINPTKKFDFPGNYNVVLTVSDNTRSDSVSKNIKIIPNPLSGNQIIYNQGQLISFSIASRYQWYKDGLPLAGATDRSYAWEGVDGVYYVVSYEGQCNALSDTVTIARVGNGKESIEVYPNPASNSIILTLPDSTGGKVILTDFLGVPYLEQTIDQPETQLSIQRIPDGVYVLQVNLPGVKTRKKVVILH
jgi:subtilisin family serine protease